MPPIDTFEQYIEYISTMGRPELEDIAQSIDRYAYPERYDAVMARLKSMPVDETVESSSHFRRPTFNDFVTLPKSAPLTMTLALLLTGVYLIGRAAPDSQSPAGLWRLGGAIFLPGTRFEVRRLLSGLFVHAGLGHLLGNLYLLLFAGMKTETSAGRGWLLSIFLLCGAISMAVSTVLQPNTVVVGASAGLLALYGFMTTRAIVAAIRTSKKGARFDHVLGTIAYPAAYLFLVSTATPPPGTTIDHIGHVTGLVTGALVYAIYELIPEDKRRSYGKTTGLLAVSLAIVAVLSHIVATARMPVG